MMLDDLIEHLEDIRDEHGNLCVEEATHGQSLYPDDVKAVNMGDDLGPIWVVQIG